jgi:hypothetical protein
VLLELRQGRVMSRQTGIGTGLEAPGPYRRTVLTFGLNRTITPIRGTTTTIVAIGVNAEGKPPVGASVLAGSTARSRRKAYSCRCPCGAPHPLYRGPQGTRCCCGRCAWEWAYWPHLGSGSWVRWAFGSVVKTLRETVLRQPCTKDRLHDYNRHVLLGFAPNSHQND